MTGTGLRSIHFCLVGTGGSRFGCANYHPRLTADQTDASSPDVSRALLRKIHLQVLPVHVQHPKLFNSWSLGLLRSFPLNSSPTHSPSSPPPFDGSLVSLWSPELHHRLPHRILHGLRGLRMKASDTARPMPTGATDAVDRFASRRTRGVFRATRWVETWKTSARRGV